MPSRTWLLALCALTLSACGQADINVIPKPVEVDMGRGSFPLSGEVTIAVTHRELKNEADFLREGLKAAGVQAIVLPWDASMKSVIRVGLAEDVELPDAGYLIEIDSEQAAVLGKDAPGLFHGIQTLLQLLPDDDKTALSWPALSIKDHPRFSWRGMHLDVCRHFFPVDVVKKYIDLLARYKMNSFHWHLTEDQGWRIEIKKYPRLTEIGAWRNGSMIGPYSDQKFDDVRYGGFYTQEQIREVVAYASERHITVVPEIEMPGHALAALAAYPALSCTGGPFEVEKGWGIFEDVFCPKEETFTFLQNVLGEVIDLFPGEYIHIGGDECPKTRWKECAHCQALMKKEGLKDEHELQSYFIQRIEKFVNGKGRKIIGWDEILEGGLAANAAVMSWRGTEGGVAAARAGHNAVMSPGSHCYFDHYQGDPAQEPLAIGGYTTVQKVYSYEPVPDSLTADEAKYILGAQGNVWTEYIATPEHLEYMALPRMIALSEVLWSEIKDRDEEDFLHRLEAEFPRLEAMRVNASKSVYDVKVQISTGAEPGFVRVEMEPPMKNTICEATCLTCRPTEPRTLEDDNAPYVWHDPFVLNFDGTFQFQAANKDGPVGRPITRTFSFNLATARPITCDPPPNERYAEGGGFTLVDGVVAGKRRVNYEWLGWLSYETPIAITVDLGELKDIKHIDIGALEENYSWIHLPSWVRIEVSADTTQFTQVAEVGHEPDAKGRIEFGVDGAFKARYVRFHVQGIRAIPDGLPGAGEAPWVFLDEITVN